MADSADTFFGVVVTLAVLTAIASGASGGTVPTTNTTGTQLDDDHIQGVRRLDPVHQHPERHALQPAAVS